MRLIRRASCAPPEIEIRTSWRAGPKGFGLSLLRLPRYNDANEAPPSRRARPGRVVSDVPPKSRPDRSFDVVSKHWAVLGGFQTAAECKAAQTETMQSAGRMLNDPSITDGQFLAQQSLRAMCKCVADDDPRLKDD